MAASHINHNDWEQLLRGVHGSLSAVQTLCVMFRREKVAHGAESEQEDAVSHARASASSHLIQGAVQIEMPANNFYLVFRKPTATPS